MWWLTCGLRSLQHFLIHHSMYTTLTQHSISVDSPNQRWLNDFFSVSTMIDQMEGCVQWGPRLLLLKRSLIPWGQRHLASLHLHGDPTDMRESTSVFQIRTINRSKLDKRQVSVIDSRKKWRWESRFMLLSSGLQNIFEIILFTAPSQNISRCYVNLWNY